MKKHVQEFEKFLNEVSDPTYYQETFYFTILISMSKDIGGSRDETKNDIRAISEVLTVTLVEQEKGGVQRDLGTKYLSTLKIHVRKLRDVSKESMMKRIIKATVRLKGISVLRYKETKPKQRKKAFHGAGSYVKRLSEIDYQKVRRQKAGEYAKDKAEYVSTGPQKTGGSPYTNPYPKKRGGSAPPIVGATGGAFGLEEVHDAPEEDPKQEAPNGDSNALDRLYEDVIISIGGDAEVNKLMAFDIQSDLQQKIWNDDTDVRPGVRAALLNIVEEFLEGLDLDINIKDIIITGSIANYNWSNYSDIDIHILVDFKDVNDNTEMVKKFFDAVRSNWNKLHNIEVKGHEVEIYVQDEQEPHVSTGVYSLMNDRWLVKPKKVRPAIDRHTATKKMKSLAREIDKLSNLFDHDNPEQALKMAERLKNKIKRMRLGGLEKTGIYSPENLAFKMLRRSGDIEQLYSVYTQAYDRVHSLDQ
ncbi:MAG TPA: hypothetical protein EYN67_20615 [Flavobacteriales bacterium]|nr:hypothetical protein [Flavobacteriales bacterium]